MTYRLLCDNILHQKEVWNDDDKNLYESDNSTHHLDGGSYRERLVRDRLAVISSFRRFSVFGRRGNV